MVTLLWIEAGKASTMTYPISSETRVAPIRRRFRVLRRGPVKVGSEEIRARGDFPEFDKLVELTSLPLDQIAKRIVLSLSPERAALM